MLKRTRGMEMGSAFERGRRNWGYVCGRAISRKHDQVNCNSSYLI